jgi:hypothetical protein
MSFWTAIQNLTTPNNAANVAALRQEEENLASTIRELERRRAALREANTQQSGTGLLELSKMEMKRFTSMMVHVLQPLLTISWNAFPKWWET